MCASAPNFLNFYEVDSRGAWKELTRRITAFAVQQRGEVMAAKAVDRLVAELSDKIDNVQEWVQAIAKNVTDASELKGYWPGQKPKRGIGLPVMLALGGLALIGGLTLLSGVAQNNRVTAPQRKSAIEPSHETVRDDTIEVNDLKPLTKERHD
jgi:hypothetical protein